MQPVFAVLVAGRKQMDTTAWKIWVVQTLTYVKKNPIEYLGDDLPDHKLLTTILDEIEIEFFKEMHTFKNAQKIQSWLTQTPEHLK